MKANTDSQPSNPLELAWEKGFAALKKFKAREKHCRVPRGHREVAFNLGTWVVNQRNRKDTLSVQRRRSLEAIGFNWTLLIRDSWEEGFAALKEFKAREGHCQVPEQHEEGSLKLGSWVARQRTKRQTMSTAWRRQLDDRFHETCGLEPANRLWIPRWDYPTRSGIMARWRQALELAMSREDIESLSRVARSRGEPARRVERAQMLLDYRENPSFFAVGQKVGVHHQTVERCVERAVAYGPLAALDDRPRPGKEPTITPEAKAWLVSLACDKAKDHGYPHELWTTRLLAQHARQN